MSFPDPQADTALDSDRRRWTFRILFVAVLALLAWSVASELPPVPVKAKGDDQYYLRYLQAVGNDGLRAFPGLFERWNASPVDRIFPSPLRVGFVLTSVAWGRIVGPDYRSLQTLSLACFLLACVLNYAFARRHFGEERACLLAALAAFSPLLMGLSRLAFADSYAALCTTAAIWLFLEVLKDPSRRWKRLVFSAALVWTVLVKEPSVLLVPAFVLFLLYERFVRREPHDLVARALDFVLAGATVFAVLVLAAGGFGTLSSTVHAVIVSPATNRYAQRFGSGPWFRPILDFLLLSPWTTLLGIGGFWWTATRLHPGRYERERVCFAFVCASMLLALSFFTKNVRYATALELPTRALAALFVCDVVLGSGTDEGSAPRRARVVAAGAVLLLCFLDWRNYQLFWVEHPGADPITQFLVDVRKLVPAR
jgi:4-amino-4-deoxy-L-arabinose transferase-like glycosyltransferase